MKSKKISFKVAESDVRLISKNVVTLIINRLGENFRQSAAKLEGSFSSADSVGIMTELQELCEVLENSIKELTLSADLIEQIPDLEESGETPEKK